VPRVEPRRIGVINVTIEDQSNTARARKIDCRSVITLTLYSKPGCHLCDEMKTVINRVVSAKKFDLAVAEIDISTDRDLELRFGLEIPVLMADGRKVAKHRVTEAELLKILEASRGRSRPP
jgi:hypothetical protein